MLAVRYCFFSRGLWWAPTIFFSKVFFRSDDIENNLKHGGDYELKKSYFFYN